jgi:hypothetical protein
MGTLILFFIISIFLVPITWFWIEMVDFMDQKHPDYKGDDLI